MYKIYVNDLPLILTDNLLHPSLTIHDRKLPIYPYEDHKKELIATVAEIKQGKFQNGKIFYNENLSKLYKKFAAEFRVIYAGGGVVFNQNNEALFIYRNKKWDLPKGKTEKNESIDKTALREVMEEVGIKRLEMVDFLCHTYHIYKTRKGEFILKNTFWFAMSTNQESYKLQKEEGIEKAKWQKVASFLNYTKPYYSNIADVCRKAIHFENIPNESLNSQIEV